MLHIVLVLCLHAVETFCGRPVGLLSVNSVCSRPVGLLSMDSICSRPVGLLSMTVIYLFFLPFRPHLPYTDWVSEAGVVLCLHALQSGPFAAGLVGC